MDEKNEKKNVFLENLSVLTTPDGIQKYFFGTKKNGDPRAVYDIVKDYVKPGKKKKKGKKADKNSDVTSYSFYLNAKQLKKKKKKKKCKKGNKHWHIGEI